MFCAILIYLSHREWSRFAGATDATEITESRFLPLLLGVGTGILCLIFHGSRESNFYGERTLESAMAEWQGWPNGISILTNLKLAMTRSCLTGSNANTNPDDTRASLLILL